MNERMKVLAEQAKFIAEETINKKISKNAELDAFAEKFAELIVAECLDVVAMRIYLGPVEMCRQECKALAADIKEHFGVNE
jgi:hypothetical protein